MFVKLRLHTVIVLFAAISMIACGDPSPGNGNAVPDSGSLGDGGLFDGQIGDDDVTASDDAKGGDDAASSDDTTAATDVTGGDDTAVATDAGGDDDASSGDDAGTAGDGGGTADGSATDGSTTDGAGTCPGGTGCACEKADDCDSKDCRPPAGGGAKVCQPPCKPTTPPDEVCDGIDNDCNDKIDDTTCDDGNLCTENSCDKGTDDKYACTASPTKDGESCDDGSKCTENDACSQGKCAGSAVDCNDSNPCTDDSCDPKTGCTNANNTGVCDDGSVCTEGEACADGKCAGGKTKVCDDGNSCTKDACDIAVGCTTTNDDGAACDDTDPCTDKDACKDGACAAGVAKSCDDSDPCTIDLCDSKTGKCSNEKAKDGGSCNDGNPCTDTDVCTGGKCAGQKSTCDDSDPCTADSCDPKKGCINTASTGGDCDDSNPCTEADKCGKDGCTGQLKDCDDKNTCTSDSCDPKTGCTNTAVDGNCDDGDKCTSTDACKDGACSGTGGKDCDDGNPCTADGCDATTGECTHKAQAGKCDDGSKCTSDDKCDGGKCTGKSADCDDSKPCTTDTCDKDTGCKHDNNTDSCDDGNACTSKDVCEDGKCVGAPLPKSTCDDKNVCTKDSCNPKTGCVNTNADGVTCDDGNACTGKDTCKAGQCTPGANTCQCKSNEDCKDDGNLCNGTPMCQNNKCVTNPKTVVTCDASKDTSCKVNTCNKGNGQCALQVTNEGKVCKEGSKCTVNNLCTKGVCVNSTKPKCVDGNACTTDLCDAKTGDCAFKAIAGCTACKDASVCDDKNPCTKDACAGGKCSNTPISGCSLAPDLKPGTPSLNKTLYLAGSSLTAKYVVSNVGFSSAGSRFDRLYLSKDTKLGAGDMLIGTKTVASLGSKKLQLVTFTAKVPEATKTGGWYVIVVVDATNKVKEANEGNNRSVRLTKVQGLSDLRINTYKPSTTATFQGGKVSFSLVVSNGGSIKAPITKAQFYISKDAKIDSKDLKAYSWNVSALDPGKSWSGTRYALIPKTLPNGTYYIGLQVDDAKAVLEANENNNIRWVKVAVGPAPDIQALAFSGSTTMYAASKYTMSMTEKNIGDKSAGAYVNSIFLSTNTTWDKSDIKLLDIKRGGLLKGAQVSVKALATIPAATKTGTYYLIFRADSTNAIAEKSEFNNQRWLKVNILGRSDLVPYTTLPNAKGWAPGATGTVSYRERNIGTGKSSTYYSRFYLSANGVLGSGDIALTTNLLRGALSPTQVSGYGKATFKIPTTVKPGKYYLLHRVDSTSKNIEVSESNNIKAIAVTILAKPDLAPTAVKLSKTSANAGTSVGVSYTITNKGGSATGTSYTGFYLSTSATSVAGPLVGV
ncbi:MAG: hypothetical protein KC502_19605, partial [Myxococcales bacterium]|nr:hypothetical protein [Myxococcales bacterium]